MDHNNILSKVQEIRKKIGDEMKELSKVKPAEVKEEIENVKRFSKSIASKLIVQNSTLDAYLIQLKLDKTKRKRDYYEETKIDTINSRK